MPPTALARVMDFHCLYGPACAWFGNLQAVKPVSDIPANMPWLEVAIRKRPLLPFEQKGKEWDCVDVRHWQGDAYRVNEESKSAYLLCHDGALAASGRRLVMKHRYFGVDHALDHDAGDKELLQVLQPLIDFAREGKGATLLLLGQTGTGKTHSLLGALRLFEQCFGETGLEVQFFEVAGQKCFDLLADRKLVHLRADENDKVHIRGAVTETLTADNYESRLKEALELRSSKETDRNPMSSRSHAVLQIKVGTGELRIVDLAGSERNYETTKMDAKEHRAFAENSKSLMALRACFRALHKPGRKPYRESRLTHLLSDSFAPGHRTTVLATLSPSATDQIHTVHTLELVSKLCPRLDGCRANLEIELPLSLPKAGVSIEQWSCAELSAWLGSVEDGRFEKLVLPPGMDGEALCQLGSLGEAFDREMRDARSGDEGISWNIAGREENKAVMEGVFEALQKERQAITEFWKKKSGLIPCPM